MLRPPGNTPGSASLTETMFGGADAQWAKMRRDSFQAKDIHLKIIISPCRVHLKTGRGQGMYPASLMWSPEQRPEKPGTAGARAGKATSETERMAFASDSGKTPPWRKPGPKRCLEHSCYKQVLIKAGPHGPAETTTCMLLLTSQEEV